MSDFIRKRFQGCVFGSAIGDALGKRYEGMSPEFIAQHYTCPLEFVRNPPSQELRYTDDTEMTIALLETLSEKGCVETDHLAQAFVANYHPWRGYGRGARKVIEAMEDGEDYQHVAENLFETGSYGNGAAMRVSPVGLLFQGDLSQVAEEAKKSAMLTHTHPLGIEGAVVMAIAIALCVKMDSWNRESFFDALLSYTTHPDFKEKLNSARTMDSYTEVSSLGNGIAAIDSVPTAIACFALAPNLYAECVGQAVLLGGDTDTIAAMTGSLCGAFLGIDAIPNHLLDRFEDDVQVKGKTTLFELADKLYHRYTQKTSRNTETNTANGN